MVQIWCKIKKLSVYLYCIVNPLRLMTVNYFLRSTKKDQPVPVWARVRSPRVDVWLPLDIYILPGRWDKKKGLPRSYNKNTDAELYQQAESITKRLNDLRDEIIILNDQAEEKGQPLTREQLVKFTAKKDKGEDTAPRAIHPYLEWLTKQMKAGTFKHGSERYDNNTIKAWNSFTKLYEAFEKDFEQREGRVLVWSAIDKAVFDSFVGFLEKSGYLIKSRNKYIITFKAAIRYAAVYHHLHNNLECLAYMQKQKEVEGCSTTKTYLNAEEVQALYNMPLEPGSLKDQVRDLFLVGVYTAQRVSDYTNISRENFGQTASGTKVIRLTQEKTRNTVVVPIISDNLQAIAEKYNYNLPRVTDVIINRYIKDILKELSQTVESLKVPVKTVLTMSEKQAEQAKTLSFERDAAGNVIKPKYDCITTHSARRSGITNLYKTNLFTTRQIMSISGHKTESSFLLYLAESSEELADEIAKIQSKAKNQQGKTNEDLF